MDRKSHNENLEVKEPLSQKQTKTKISNRLKRRFIKPSILTDLPTEEDVPTRVSFREFVFNTMEDPKAGTLGFYYNLFSNFIVCISILVLVLITLPEFWQNTPRILLAFEYFFFIFYAQEFLVKFICCPRKDFWIWLANPFTIIDILVLISYFPQIILQVPATAGIGRIFRVAKVAQVIKIGRSSETFHTVFQTLKHSRDGFLLLLFTVGVGTVVFSSIMFYAEQINSTFDSLTKTWIRDDGVPSSYQSIPESFWWCIVTLTTTGFGDVHPFSLPGKIVCGIAMVAGTLIIAFPITLFGIHFTQIWRYEIRKIRLYEVEHPEIEEHDSHHSLERVLRKIERHHHHLSEDLESVISMIQGTQLRHQQIAQSISDLNQQIGMLKKYQFTEKSSNL